MSVDFDANAAFRRLRELNSKLIAAKVNDHERAHVLINASIHEGFDRGNRITGALARLDFDKRHVGIVLQVGLRAEPEWPNWGRTPEGIYFAPPQELPQI